MPDLLIRIGSSAASDSWGFVGVVSVGDVDAYRTLEAFPTPSEATEGAQRLVVDVLGDLLAGKEWRRLRDRRGTLPTREDYSFSALGRSRSEVQPGPRSDGHVLKDQQD